MTLLDQLIPFAIILAIAALVGARWGKRGLALALLGAGVWLLFTGQVPLLMIPLGILALLLFFFISRHD